ncbi:MAG: hypothetical protein V4858_30460 [Pseudomonadota bacterium]
MKTHVFNASPVVRLVLAAELLLALAAVAGADLVPTVPLPMLLLYAAVGGLLLVAVVVLAAVASLTVSQFVLRHGGTDAQWFWFRSEPPGLVELRRQTKALAARSGREPS